MTPALGPLERRLLLCCGRLEPGPEELAAVEALLGERLDWDAVVFGARLHSIGPLVYANLDRIGAWSRAPDDARRGLFRLSHRAAYQNRLYADENRRLVRAFDAAGVPVIIHKGMSLVERIYGGLGRRPLIDLIFLVPEGAVDLASRALADHGYRRRLPAPVEGLYRWTCPQRHFIAQREMRMDVLLQWNPINWPRLHRFSAEPLWDRAEQATVNGESVRVLSPIDQVLYLCVQADNHGFYNRVADGLDPVDLLFREWTNNRLIRFTDLYEVIRRFADAIDWNLLVERAHDAAIEDAARASLSLTNSLLGPVVPTAVLEALDSERSLRLRRHVARAMAADRRWTRVRPSSRVRIGHFVGWAEYCFPERKLVGARYGPRPLSLGLHATRALARSGLGYGGAFARAAPGRAARFAARTFGSVT